MKLENFCCIGAELADKVTQSTRMPQIYFYRAYEEETLEEMKAVGFFNQASDRVMDDDIIILYEPNNQGDQLQYTKVASNFGGIVTLESFIIDPVLRDEVQAKIDNITAQLIDATETERGLARLATKEEALAGTDDTTIMTPFKTGLVVDANVGKGVQLGFNGTLQSGTITFEPDQSPYEIKHGYDYEIDLLFAAAGSIPNSTKLVIKNGEETIQIVNVKHSDFNTPITYQEMKQVCRYDNEIGWRWIFHARFSVTDSGVKVMVMPATVVETPDNVVTTDTAQNITSQKNFINSATSTTPDAHTGMSISLQNNQADLTADTMNDDGSVNFKYQGVRMLDKNGEEMSFLYSSPDGVGGSFTRLGTSSKVNGQYVDSFVELEVDSSGKGHFYIPDVDDDNTVSGNQAATVEWVKANALPSQTGNSGKYLQTNGSEASWQQGSGNPVGTIIAWSTSTAPAGYLICDGSAVSRTTYAALFAVIGGLYSTGIYAYTSSDVDYFINKETPEVGDAIYGSDGTAITATVATITETGFTDSASVKYTRNSGNDKSTFNLPNYGFIDSKADIGVKGNGLALGITDGTAQYGMTCRAISGSNRLTASTGAYKTAPIRNDGAHNASAGTYGVVEDTSGSGLIAIPSISSFAKYCIKY